MRIFQKKKKTTISEEWSVKLEVELQSKSHLQDPKIFLHYHLCSPSSNDHLSLHPGSKTS